MRTVAFCEVDEYCRRVLAKHWPGVPCYGDIRELTAERLGADGISVDLICGGFPCQDISFAGRGAGIEGERSGLWSEYARLVGELRPRRVVVENVTALLSRGLGVVLGDLAALGYDAEWHCIPASHVGAPHRRDRAWIVAHPDDGQRGQQDGTLQAGWNATDDGRASVADTDDKRLERRLRESLRQCTGERFIGAGGSPEQQGTWLPEPNVGRVAHGVPNRVDRLKALGNAVVPQIPEIIGRAIMESERATRPT
jgi:DNA (cytosine-5)-methyltransferase 1